MIITKPTFWQFVNDTFPKNTCTVTKQFFGNCWNQTEVLNRQLVRRDSPAVDNRVKDDIGDWELSRLLYTDKHLFERKIEEKEAFGFDDCRHLQTNRFSKSKRNDVKMILSLENNWHS